MPYASKVRARDKAGNEVGRHARLRPRHAHDRLGRHGQDAAGGLKDRWKGTLVFHRPARGGDRRPGPRRCWTTACSSGSPSPIIAWPCTATPASAPATSITPKAWRWPTSISVDIVVKGKGGHGCRAAHARSIPSCWPAASILDLQTIVSREINPTDPAVVTVGSIHGGTKHNIIPNEVQVADDGAHDAGRRAATRSERDQAHRQGRRRGSAARRNRKSRSRHDEFTPALLNDRKLTRRMVGLFKDVLGEDKIHERPADHGRRGFRPLRPRGHRRSSCTSSAPSNPSGGTNR